MRNLEASVVVDAPVADCYRCWMDFERFPDFMRRVVSVRRIKPEEPAKKGIVHASGNLQRDNEETVTRQLVNEMAPRADNPPLDSGPALAGAPASGGSAAMGGAVTEGEPTTGWYAATEDHPAADGSAWRWEVRGPFGRIYSWHGVIVQNIPEMVVSWASPPEQDLATSGSVNFLRQPGDRQTLVEVKMAYSAPAAPFGELLADVTRYGEPALIESLREFKRYVERGAPPR